MLIALFTADSICCRKLARLTLLLELLVLELLALAAALAAVVELLLLLDGSVALLSVAPDCSIANKATNSAWDAELVLVDPLEASVVLSLVPPAELFAKLEKS